ncbi:MAG: hypothetical protein QXT27_01860 [Pyrobaculum sp.]
MPEKAKKMHEMMSKWKKDIQEKIGPKLERYYTVIDRYDLRTMSDKPGRWKEYTISGLVVIEIPIASEGLITAISIARDALSDK